MKAATAVQASSSFSPSFVSDMCSLFCGEDGGRTGWEVNAGWIMDYKEHMSDARGGLNYKKEMKDVRGCSRSEARVG